MSVKIQRNQRIKHAAGHCWLDGRRPRCDGNLALDQIAFGAAAREFIAIRPAQRIFRIICRNEGAGIDIVARLARTQDALKAPALNLGLHRYATFQTLAGKQFENRLLTRLSASFMSSRAQGGVIFLC